MTSGEPVFEALSFEMLLYHLRSISTIICRIKDQGNDGEEITSTNFFLRKQIFMKLMDLGNISSEIFYKEQRKENQSDARSSTQSIGDSAQ